MTSEDLKILHPMKEVVESYGIKINRSGFCMCPFHHDNKSASMKIYKDNFHCFGCGADGDIFTFVMLMDNLTFKEAFKSLGGCYTHSFSEMREIEKIKRKRAKTAELRTDLKFRITLCQKLIDIYRMQTLKYPPFSDEWCLHMNALQYQIAELEYLTDMR
ncbi:CHC2 zinc finger domain-containing protein [[Clostridium] polysaccharolyticum]|uniref:CHC2 zinc finger n=1 Tax=[Clostridium] polysaccharolyticum TaxID=29364 RepID=A0A1H9YJB0_9FIRM|nr:CHC2 zinc finger domain-containing protein [[Clostridium] polysaccharolyticum]SES69149.1 CHC2 zinc finger [[Clostridium] polysaccharolyticum]